jgi:signal transduction histidine kinase/ligand-binding sensor domain-containing protein/CheY-like chemotaxis protein
MMLKQFPWRNRSGRNVYRQWCYLLGFLFLTSTCVRTVTPEPQAGSLIDSLATPTVINMADLPDSSKPEIIRLTDRPRPVSMVATHALVQSFTNPVTGQVIPPAMQGKGSFTNYTLKDGLATELILCALTDRFGRLWFGTQTGVILYDGKSFTNFNTAHGIAGGAVWSILEDRNGALWFASMAGGVSRYDGRSITTFTTKDGLISNLVTSITEDQSGKIWIGTEGGRVSCYDGNAWTSFSLSGGFDFVWDILEDREGNMWFATTSNGVYKYAEVNGSRGQQISTHFTTDDGLVSNVGGSSIIEDNQGNLWFGSDGGISFYDGQSFKNLTTDDGLVHHYVNRILKDRDGNLWFATHGGVSFLDIHAFYNGEVQFVNFTLSNGLPHESISAMAEDQAGNLWFGTGAGISRYEGVAFTFFTDIIAPGIVEDASGNLWFGKNRYDGSSLVSLREMEHLLIRDVLTDRSGKLWFASFGGLLGYDGSTVTRFTDQQGLIGTRAWCLKEDRRGGLWIGTRSGVSYFDGTTFTNYGGDQGLHLEQTWRMYEDKAGHLWFGTWEGGGISCFDGNAFVNFTADQGLADNVIWSIEGDQQGNIWIGTQAGLSVIREENLLQIENYLRDPESVMGSIFENYSVRDGLPDNGIREILNDLEGNIVIGTNAGIAVLHEGIEALSNPDRIEVFNHNNGHHLSNINFGQSTLIKDNQGIIWIATESGKTGLVRFDYDKLKKNDQPPVVFLEKIKINDEQIAWNHLLSAQDLNQTRQLKSAMETEEAMIFGIPLSDRERVSLQAKFAAIQFDSIAPWYPVPQNLVLPFVFNNITFEFNAVIPARNHSVSYQYMLEGYDQGWRPVSDQSTVRYGNIAEGHYTFKLKVRSPDRVWSEPLLYTFTVLPPWWRTWWAYVLYVSGASILLYSVYRFQLSRKLAFSEIIHLKNLDELKTNLYTNITHEFRTPLTVILGMADQMRDHVQKGAYDQVEQTIKMIRHNGQNLLKLVNEMLDMAKLDSSGLELQLIQGDMVLFVKYVTDSFQSMASMAEVSLEVSSRIEELIMDFDTGKMTSILSNLISNAIKFTPQGGAVSVTLDKVMEKNSPCLYLVVSDNGTGIVPSELPHIFDRFYQADRSLTREAEGTGIGLAYTRELVNLMQGTIEVNSEPGKGSEFKVTIPVSNEAIKGEPSSIRKLSHENFPVVKGLIPPGSHVNMSDRPLVLIIEDNADVTQYLKWCLEDNYFPIHAPDGLIGVEMAYERIPDIIICDVMMPGRDGFEVCAMLKSDVRTDHIPIIMLTAKATSRDRLKGLSKGADAYLTKPFSQEELLTRLEQLILVRKRIFQKFERDGFAVIMHKRTDNPETKFLREVISIVQQHMGDSDFDADQLARKLFLSESQVYRKLKAISGKSTAIFIRSVRLQKARELIITTNLPISQVAYEVGFNDPSWFSRAFKDEFGKTPTDLVKARSSDPS